MSVYIMFNKRISDKNLPQLDFDHFQIEQHDAKVTAVSFY